MGSFFKRSDTETPTSLFEDLYNEDLVHVAHCVGCRQLAPLEVSPYQRGLLERGLNHWAQGEYPDRRMEQGMGYTTSVGMMLMDKIAGHCERSKKRFTKVRTDLGKVETKLATARGWSVRVNEKIEGIERHIWMLIASWTVMGDTMDRMRAEMDGLLLINQRMVDAIVQLRAGQIHNWDNPIVIDDDLSSSEEMVAEPPEVLEQFCLVPIKDEEVADSKEGDSDEEEEVWEISREEFEDKVVDTRGESPEL